jgi:hypothetical protein
MVVKFGQKIMLLVKVQHLACREYNTMTNQSFAHKLVYDFGYTVRMVVVSDTNIGATYLATTEQNTDFVY